MQRFFSSRALAIVAVSLIALVGGALLAWWQWTRYTSSTGTLQNLGYVLQWPLFGVFPGFMFWRIHRGAQREAALDAAAEQAEQSEQTEQTEHAQEPVTPKKPEAPGKVDPRLTYVQNKTVTYVAEEDQELLDYNRRLAQLADQEQHHG